MEAARKRPDGPRPGSALILTAGDPAGIGPELIQSLTRDLSRCSGSFLYFSTGTANHRDAFLDELRALGRQVQVLPGAPSPREIAGAPDTIYCIDCTGGIGEVAPGDPGKRSGELAFQALKQAVDWIAESPADCRGLLTAPVSKEWIARATENDFPGHTDYFSRRFGVSVMMLMYGKNISVVPLTVHLPLRRVGAELERVLQDPATLELLETLRTLPAFNGQDGRGWALCGLNPHAGEGGELGGEEIEFIQTVADSWRAAGLPVAGPLPGDTVFMSGNRERFSLVFSCYHDQGLGPFKALEGVEGVNCTIGLPFMRTSPDHGTAFDIAGQGMADPGSMRRALAVLNSGELAVAGQGRGVS